MDKYEYLWTMVRGNNMPGDLLKDDRAYSYEELMGMNEKMLVEKTGITLAQARYLVKAKMEVDIDREYEFFLKSGANVVTVMDDGYPDRLKYIDNRPFALFYYGSLPKDDMPSVAIIGARNCSEYGRYMAQSLGHELGCEKINIISGMAYGIDGIAGEAALNGWDASGGKDFGKGSFAVLGCGVDVCYPRANRKLYERLKNDGGIISEYPIGASAKPENFPMRNRIISGLADIIIVVEARLKSGTFITVDYALMQGREIMVVPGRATDPLSVGCNALMFQGASPVQSKEDVTRLLGTISPHSYMQKNGTSDFKTKQLSEYIPKEKLKILLEREENMVYSVLDFYSLSPEDIADALNMDIFKIMNILISLEMKGVVREIGKNLYVKCQ